MSANGIGVSTALAGSCRVNVNSCIEVFHVKRRRRVLLGALVGVLVMGAKLVAS